VEESQKLNDLSIKLEKVLTRQAETDKVLKEKTKAVVEESEARRRLLEQLELAKKKIETLSTKVDSSTVDSALQNEVNDYKVCLHFSSQFCKGCIDDLVNSRQRKCPKCGMAFSQNDVKQFYL
ncbi:E3 ubiquitin-protein ligase bre1, partial [Chytridiales sp. JEL 0842]